MSDTLDDLDLTDGARRLANYGYVTIEGLAVATPFQLLHLTEAGRQRPAREVMALDKVGHSLVPDPVPAHEPVVVEAHPSAAAVVETHAGGALCDQLADVIGVAVSAERGWIDGCHPTDEQVASIVQWTRR